ncbi:hypothetical protein [Granulicella aggregans]|uniref:hypothetical protein n=1 Tax=Granulicella aggregans TaxID=474949 RepID=UPI0021E049AC|nr:hypothetical protein [Granulicella aggregans]
MDGPTSNPKIIDAFLASLAAFATRKERYGTLDCDRCVDFFEIVRSLASLNHGSHQWAYHISPALDFPNAGRRATRYLLVAYSNPDPTGIPNHLCFCVPLFFRSPSRPDKPSIVACFDIEAITPLSHGLYWENDRLAGDFLGDFDLFYEPLANLFWNQDSSSVSPNTEVIQAEPQPDRMSIEGVTYQESITALLWRWVLSKEELEREIDPYSPN